MHEASSDTRKTALREASEWLVRLHEDEVTDAALEAWGNWMASSPSNARAFDDVAGLWDASAALTSADIDAALPSQTTAPPIGAPRSRRHRRWAWAAVFAAACAVLAIAVVDFQARETQQFVTANALRRQVTLSDGSTLDLDAASRITVEYSRSARKLVLEQGRAYFRVAHDASRPFEVHAGGAISRAVGTQFSVGFRGEGTIAVIVAEGRVRVSDANDRTPDPRPSAREAGRNEQILFRRAGGLEGPRPVNAALTTSWIDGSVVYQGERLAVVIADLNRYAVVPLRLEDPTLGDLLVTGRWNSSSVDDWVDGLAQALHLQVVRRPGEVLLSGHGSRDLPRRDGAPAPAESR